MFFNFLEKQYMLLRCYAFAKQCDFPELWPCDKLVYLIQFRLQHCCNLDRSAQPGVLLRDPFLDMNVLENDDWGISKESLPQRKDSLQPVKF